MKSKLFIFEIPVALLTEAWYNTASSVAVVLGSLKRKEQVPWHI